MSETLVLVAAALVQSLHWGTLETSMKSFAVRSLISLCLKNLNPPCEHVNACSTLDWL